MTPDSVRQSIATIILLLIYSFYSKYQPESKSRYTIFISGLPSDKYSQAIEYYFKKYANPIDRNCSCLRTRTNRIGDGIAVKKTSPVRN